MSRTTTTNDQTRRTNLSLVLSLVHHGGSLSRAELVRTTGLNRSTVATLVNQLCELELLYETAPEAGSAVGRPSPQIHANPSLAALAVNPEVDAVTIGLVGLGGVVIKSIRHETSRVPSAREAAHIAAAVVEGMRGELDGSYRIVGVGVAVPGLVRDLDGVVRYAPGLGWNDEEIAGTIAEATGYRVWAANDASVGADAELVFGAGRGALDVVYLNGGASGVGGGIVSNGVLLHGLEGFAGELGHTLVNSAGHPCHCGASGCLETEVSRQRLLEVAGLVSGDDDALERALATSSDPLVTTEIHRQLGFLAVALRNAVNVLNPERIVLGGFLATLFGLAPERLRRLVIEDALDGPAHGVTILRSQLGSELLMIGAAELAFARVLADPAAVAADAKL